ncbi:glycosyltransferase family 2 protein [Methanocalculus taiwanensis]|uniref:glycosyltransferase family 2 protein n=1 Tax=Methanocalculus taiwanensis TaxID=106207 RepID=UPI002101B8AD|nr:glycosyltransferase family 2 protein [Methanocalculus taiwanensis]
MTLVAMPAYNEEKYIAKTVLGARKYADRVLVVDDGSTDDTVPIAEALGALVVQHETNRGYGGALQTIFATARELGAQELVIIDSDGQHNPEDIKRLLSELREGNDVVIPVAGTQSGFGAYGQRAIEAIRPGGNGVYAGADILAQVHGMKVAGIPSGTAATDGARYRGKRIAVVIPAYNEEKLIQGTLDGIPDFVTRIYVVNDASTDMTGAIIDNYAHYNARVVPVHQNPNQGPGAAVISGYSRALSDGIDIVATMDGDGQMDPQYLSKFLDPIVDGKCDFTLGNRLASSEYRGRMSKWRFFGNAILTFLTKIASGYWSMMDPQNGYTAISRRALKRIEFKDMYPRYGYLNDRLVRLNIHGFRIKNIAHPAKYGNETSTIKYGRYIVRVSNLLLRTFLRRLKMKYVILSFHPLVFFYLFGSILALIGIVGGAIALWEKFVMGYSVLFVHGTLSMLAFMLGIMFLSFAMLFDMQQEVGI